jgi:hypothetical protein
MNTPVQHGSHELLTLAEAELLTKRKVSTWRKDVRLRKVPYVKLGRQVRIPREFIEEMIAKGWRDPIALESLGRQ